MTKELKMNAIPMTEDAASTVQATNNLEYVNLMEYLPMRYPPTLEEEKNRRIVSNFKRGRCSPELKNQFTDAIKQLKEERKDVKLRVCFMPAITADKIDMIAAKKAGIKAIACLWGTKERSMLLGTAYDQAMSSPLEILPYLQ